MPDDSNALDTYIESPDGNEEFYLKTEKADRSYSSNVIIRSILETIGDVAGRDLDLRLETIDLKGVIQDSETDTYPTLTSVDTSSYAVATEKEVNFAEIFLNWGPTNGNFATLHWGPRAESGIITKIQTTEDRTSTGPEQYTFSLEFTYANVQI
jgi:hypothetical protein